MTEEGHEKKKIIDPQPSTSRGHINYPTIQQLPNTNSLFHPLHDSNTRAQNPFSILQPLTRVQMQYDMEKLDEKITTQKRRLHDDSDSSSSTSSSDTTSSISQDEYDNPPFDAEANPFNQLYAICDDLELIDTYCETMDITSSKKTGHEEHINTNEHMKHNKIYHMARVFFLVHYLKTSQKFKQIWQDKLINNNPNNNKK